MFLSHFFVQMPKPIGASDGVYSLITGANAKSKTFELERTDTILNITTQILHFEPLAVVSEIRVPIHARGLCKEGFVDATLRY